MVSHDVNKYFLSHIVLNIYLSFIFEKKIILRDLEANLTYYKIECTFET